MRLKPARKLVTMIVASVAGLLPLATGAPATAAVPGIGVCADTAATQDGAVALAARCQVRVEALDQRTATSTVRANPDGTLTMTTFVDSQYVWTQVSKTYSSQSYWSTSRDYLRVGKEYGTTNVWRSFIRFDGLTPLAGKHLLNASVSVTLSHSGVCTPTPVDLWQSQDLSSGTATTWNSTATYWQSRLVEVSAAANPVVCGQSPVVVTFGGSSVTSSLQAKTDAGSPSSTYGLRAPDESNQSAWKKFLPTTAHLDVVYDA